MPFSSPFLRPTVSRAGILLLLFSIIDPTIIVSPTSRLLSRLGHTNLSKSITLGNILYIDGGVITLWNGVGSGDSATDSGVFNTTLEPNTLFIDLTVSWTNSSVALQSISKSDAGVPLLLYEALWQDASGSAFYAYDGATMPSIGSPAPPPNQLWQFTQSSNSGYWAPSPVLPNSIFPLLSRLSGGISATGNGLGFALGGLETANTNLNLWEDEAKIGIYVPGMVIYNSSSQLWYNVSTSGQYGYSPNGYVSHGAAQFVPSFGPDGLLFVLGGVVGSSQVVAIPPPDSNYASFADAVMYDPVSQQWERQTVTGDVPEGLIQPCVVGVQGNESYEIFMYGGSTGLRDSTIASGVVSVLSIPAFHWIKQDITPTTGRYFHTCNVAGESQIISVGGAVITSDLSTEIVGRDESMPDPWPQGLGVFDLSELEWKSNFDPAAEEYVTPQVVQAYYKQNGRFPVSWSSPTVESWFTKNNGLKPQPQASSNPKAEPGKSHPFSTVDIAGGVVGGVASLALILAIAVYCCCRSRKDLKLHHSGPSSSTTKVDRVGERTWAVERPTSKHPYELLEMGRNSRVWSGARHELQS